MMESAATQADTNETSRAAAAPRTIPWFTGFLLLATLVLSVLVIVLARNNRELRAEAAALRQLSGDSALFPGEVLASLESFGPASTDASAPDPTDAPPTNAPPADALTLVDGRPGTVLLLYSGSCGACDVVMPRFAALAARHTPAGLACYAIQIDAKSPADLTHTDMGIEVRGVPGAERSWLRRVPLIPSVIVLDHEGSLVRGYYGAPDDNQWNQIERDAGTLSGVVGQS